MLADSDIKKTSISNVSIESNWQYHQPNPDNNQFDYTTGKVQISIKNNTIIPLTFTSVKIRHHCANKSTTVNGKTEKAYVEIDYAYSKLINPKESVTQIAGVYEKAGWAPCEGGLGGVTRSEIIDVFFHQHRMTPYQQRMKCGESTVSVVWALSPSLKSVLIFTETKVLKFVIAELPKVDSDARTETQLSGTSEEGDYTFTHEGKKLSLKTHVCDDKSPDKYSNDNWRAKIIYEINQWAKACKKYPEKCEKTYKTIYRSWGVRG